MTKQLFQSAYLLLLFFFCNYTFAQEADRSTQQILSALLTAKSEEQQSQILVNNKDALTVELRKAVIEEANDLRVKNEFARATEIYDLAKRVAEMIGDRAGIGYALRGISILEDIQGNNARAMDLMNKSLAIAQEANDKTLEAGCFRSLGHFLSEEGNADLAMENYQKSLRAAEEAKDKLQIAAALNAIGLQNTKLGNYAIALEDMEKSMVLGEEVGNKVLNSSTLNNMAIIHDFQGNFDLALELYQKSLKLSEELGDRLSVANTLNNMGDFRLVKSHDVALEYNKKSLKIAEELGDKKLAARACVNIGNRYRATGDYDQALNFSLKALSIADPINYKLVVSDSQRLAAKVYLSMKDYKKALEFADRAVSEAKKIGYRQSIWNALEVKGKAHSSLNQTEMARQSFEEAILTIEDWRSLIAGGEVERQSYFAEKISPYHEMIALLAGEQNSVAAFAYAERAKARVLLDVIRSGKANITEKMTSEEKEQEHKLYEELTLLNKEIQNERMDPRPDEKNLEEMEEKIRKVRLDFESFRTKLYVLHPALQVYRGEAGPLKAEEAIKLFTDSETVVLEYVVTDEKTFLMVLNSENKKPNIYTIPITQEKLAEQVMNFRTQMANRDPRFVATSQELFKLLVSPASESIKSRDKIILVPDDVLWSLPFQALQTSERKFLLEDYSLFYVPSLTVLHETRKLHKRTDKPTTLLALGNPILGKETIDRVKRVYRSEKLDPLPESEREVMVLKRLYGADRSKVYVGSDAQENRVKREAGEFDVLHLATHGIVNDVAPMYSQLIFAQGSDIEEDGVLEAWEIMNLKLNADLVVLSACDTALGKIQKGEGMIGLAWSLFVAGSPTTVASQWKVDSASTTELMLEFHKNLKSNHTKAEALRQAALKLFHTDEYHHPFYWAPYVIIGDGF